MNEIQFAQSIADIGGRLYLVGGAVRDKFMKRESHDRDFCVTGLTEEQFLSVAPEAKKVGKQFPVYLVEVDGEVCEIAFARMEWKTGRGHQDFEFRFDPSVTIRMDLMRRDFSINAMAIDVLDGSLIDPFYGASSVAMGEIRAVGPAFAEDPLRVYRAARFAAQFNFYVDTDTIRMMHSLKDELSELSVERVFEELRKALNGKSPAEFFRVLVEADVLDIHFPEVWRLIGVQQPVEHHPEGDAFEHSMLVLNEASYITEREEVRYSALCHDLGKGITPREMWPKHHGHEEAGVPLTEAMSNRLKVPTKWREAAMVATADHGRVHKFGGMKPIKCVDLLQRADKSPLGVDGLAVVAIADHRGRSGHEDQIHPYAEGLNDLWQRMKKTANGKTIPLRGEPSERGNAIRLVRAEFLRHERTAHNAR